MQDGSSTQEGSKFRRPRWSLRSQFAAWTIILAVCTALVLIVVERSVWFGLELVTVVLAFLMFLYFSAVLYYGVRFDKKEKYHFQWVSTDPSDFEVVGFADFFPGLFTEAAAEEGPVGLLLGLLADLVVSILLCFVLVFIVWLGVNLAAAAVAIVAIPLFFLFSRTLRHIVARSRRSRGDLIKSVTYALYYTVVSSAWFYALLFAAHRIAFAAGWARAE